ncbi:hypothetical protein AALB19_03390 [Oscillospiraceae bacterium 50-58]
MNKELFDSMQKQMTPSPEVRAALSEKMAQPAKKRPVPWKKYTALAACAALVIGAFSVYHLSQDHEKWLLITKNFRHDDLVQQLHSYVTVDDLTGFVQENATTATGGSEGAVRDADTGMTPQDLEQAMLDVGYTQEEIDEYQSIGYQMTWANWWKFVHQQENSEGDDPFNLDNLKTFSQKELYVRTGALPAPNTGDLPGGAYVGDVPVQVGAEDYQKLMEHFNGQYPDWYGGAYLDQSGRLVVQLVEDKDPGDKSLELQVLDWTGSDQVMFSSCKYSLAQLKELMDQLNALPDADPKCREVMASWGIDEEHNRIELTLTEANGHVLAVLCRMDPEDDAIYVQVGQRASADIANDKPSVIPEGEEPVSYDIMPGGATVPDDEDLIAEEPWYDGAHYDVEDLPQQKLPAFGVDSAPEGNSSAYEPQG